MNCNQINAKILQIINANFNTTLTIHDTKKNIFEDGVRIDSISFLQTIVELESEFDIELYDDELSFDFFSTIEEISNIIINHLENN